MAIGNSRLKIALGFSAIRGQHRYTMWRWVVGIVFTLATAALPLLDVLRFDLWSGRHIVLGEQVGFVEAAKAFAFPFLGVNVAIIVLTFSLVNLPTISVWAIFGVAMRRFLSDPTMLRIFNLTMAAALVLSLWPMLKN